MYKSHVFQVQTNDMLTNDAFISSLSVIGVIKILHCRAARDIILLGRFSFKATRDILVARRTRNYLILGVLLGHRFLFRLPLALVPVILEPYLHLHT